MELEECAKRVLYHAALEALTCGQVLLVYPDGGTITLPSEIFPSVLKRVEVQTIGGDLVDRLETPGLEVVSWYRHTISRPGRKNAYFYTRDLPGSFERKKAGLD